MLPKTLSICPSKHGVSLELAHRLEWEWLRAKSDTRQDYGEARMIGYAPVEERVYCVVFVDRGGVRRIISLRKANTREVLAMLHKRKFITPTPAEETAINAGIAADSDTYALSDEEFKLLKPVRGRPKGSKAATTKVTLTMRVDAEVLEYFKAQGRGWQTRINDALKRVVTKHS